MSFIDAMEALADVQLIAVRMTESIEPSLIVETDRVDGQGRVTFPMGDRSSHPAEIRVGGNGASVDVEPPQPVIILIEHQDIFGSADELEWVGMKINAGDAGRIASCEHRIIRRG